MFFPLMCLCIRCPKHPILLNLLLLSLIQHNISCYCSLLLAFFLIQLILATAFFKNYHQAELHEFTSNCLILANGMAIFPCGCIFHCLSQSQPLFLPFLFVYQLLFGNFLFEHFQSSLYIKKSVNMKRISALLHAMSSKRM